jgi:hypothetical protein
MIPDYVSPAFGLALCIVPHAQMPLIDTHPPYKNCISIFFQHVYYNFIITTQRQLMPIVTHQSIHGIWSYNFHADLLLNPHPIGRIQGPQGRIAQLHPLVPIDHLQFSPSTCQGLGGSAHQLDHLARQL